ncbi:hypothetical protein B0H19DRAFT_1380563, partial [Mycena capillaripes]
MDTSPCSAVLGTSELCTLIIDSIRYSTDDLKSCALVSRRLTFPAQSYLFRFVNLDSNPGDDFHNTRRAASLGQSMEDAPHLRLLVRNLHTPVHEAMLAHVIKMRLTRLARRSLKGPMFSVASRSAARDLMTIPSIKWLTLSTGFITHGELKLLFSRRTAPLRTLDLLRFDVQRTAN